MDVQEVRKALKSWIESEERKTDIEHAQSTPQLYRCVIRREVPSSKLPGEGVVNLDGEAADRVFGFTLVAYLPKEEPQRRGAFGVEMRWGWKMSREREADRCWLDLHELEPFAQACEDFRSPGHGYMVEPGDQVTLLSETRAGLKLEAFNKQRDHTADDLDHASLLRGGDTICAQLNLQGLTQMGNLFRAVNKLLKE